MPLSVSLRVSTATGGAGPAPVTQALQESLLRRDPHDAVSGRPNIKGEAHVSPSSPSLAEVVLGIPPPDVEHLHVDMYIASSNLCMRTSG